MPASSGGARPGRARTLELRAPGAGRAAHPTPGLPIVAVRLAGAQRVAPCGDVDALTAPVLGDHLDRLVDAGEQAVVVDLARVNLLDAAGLGVLAGVRRRLAAQGGALAVASPCPLVARVLDATGLACVLGTADLPAPWSFPSRK